MSGLTRRRLLAGSVALAGGAYGAYRLDRGAPDADFTSWTPDAGTWPLRRYDPANTGHNPNASPPRERPAIRTLADTSGLEGADFRPLVGPDHLALAGSQLAAYPRGGGDPVRTDAAQVPVAGFGPDGTLHTVRTVNIPGSDTVAVGYAGDDLRESYRYTVGHAFPTGLTVGASGVYVGTSRRDLAALHPDHGPAWWAEGTAAALAGERLYTSGTNHHTAVAYAERTGVDRLLSAGPARLWSGGPACGLARPAVADGRVVLGSYPSGCGTDSVIDDRTGVVAYGAASGDRLWKPRRLGRRTSPAAVVGARGYVGVGTDDLEAGAVVCLDLETGETVWRDEVGWYAFDPVVAGDTLLVAGEKREADTGPLAGAVRAYDRLSGEVLWTLSFEGTRGGSLALVGDRVLATMGSSLYELVPA